MLDGFLVLFFFLIHKDNLLQMVIKVNKFVIEMGKAVL